METTQHTMHHIKCAPGEIGRYVILPGDPGRVEKIAAYLDNPRHVQTYREYTTWNGELDGETVTVMSTGMGGPSTAIGIEELKMCGADTLIRVGTCGGVDPELVPGTLIIPTGAIRKEGTGREMNFVVPAPGLKEVEKILTDTEDSAAFTLGPKHILFQIGKATLVCRLLEGEFLDWRRVVPTDCPIKLVAHVSDLASSVERVGLIVSEKYKSPVRCVFSNQELLMRTSTSIGAAEDRCSFAGDGKELEIGFNVRYLADALRVVPSEEVTLELTNGLSPIVLTPVDDKYDFAYMVLPVRIKNA